MKQKKEEWVNRIVDSSKEIKRAEASPFLFTRINEKIKEQESPAQRIVPLKRAWIYAVSFLILIIFNLGVMLNSFSDSSSKQEIYRVAESYNLLPGNTLYTNEK
jgi:hypothetical protein